MNLLKDKNESLKIQGEISFEMLKLVEKAKDDLFFKLKNETKELHMCELSNYDFENKIDSLENKLALLKELENAFGNDSN